MSDYLLITESALDLILTQRLFGTDGMPDTQVGGALNTKELPCNVKAIATAYETSEPYTALISLSAINKLIVNGEFSYLDLYGRIARVVNALGHPPIHLPRGWSEFHYKNQLTFFALPKDWGAFRWIVDIDSARRCARFESITTGDAPQDLAVHKTAPWPTLALWESFRDWITQLRKEEKPHKEKAGLVEEVDLKSIGSASIVQSKAYEQWLSLLNKEQIQVLDRDMDQSVRIIGPAGSGKTLALCMRALRIARDEQIISGARKILIVTHTWAMAERIDGILLALNCGDIPGPIIVSPLLDVLKDYGAQIGQQVTRVIGDDSKSGRIATIEIIQEVLPESNTALAQSLTSGVSDWIKEAVTSPMDGHQRGELVLNLYEEFTGVLAAGGVSMDDQKSLQNYLSDTREDWMPPFVLMADRRFVLEIYRKFLRVLADRGAITTDQFVLDSIRILETFAWRMRRESEGFDYIFVDELQLFDSQERLAIELLGRTGGHGLSAHGVPFTTAEDPSQGIYSVLNARKSAIEVDQSVYLECVHRFRGKIFDFIRFLYQKFPLNTIPLRVDQQHVDDLSVPTVYRVMSDDKAIDSAIALVQKLSRDISSQDHRICIATLGNTEDVLYEKMELLRLPVIKLHSFDDVEQLAYRKKSIVIAPWQFIGGTQFSHVIVVSAGIKSPNNTFERLRELTAIYLACSRAMISLNMVCGVYMPHIIQEAIEEGFMVDKDSHVL